MPCFHMDAEHVTAADFIEPPPAPLLAIAGDTAAPPPSNATARLRQAYAEGIRPETQLLVSDWADAHRKLPKKSSAEGGPWRTSRTPFLREPMDAFSATSTVQEVVLKKGSQIGGTEVLLNALGYIIDHVPGPAMLVLPTVETAKRFSRQRIDPLVNDNPRLARKVSEGRSRDSSNTILSKDFAGGTLVVTGANSAVGLRSMPAQYVLMDEIDGYPGDVDEEGSPIELVEVRQRTFPRRKTLKVSSPTIEGRSAIESAYEASDQRRFYVPCPACGEMQPLEFARLVWSKRLLLPEHAVYECRACEHPIQDHQKTWMLERGEWRPQRPERAAGRIRGYHINALYSPVGWMSWGDIALKFVKVRKDPEKFRVFVNTVLGEVWSSAGADAPGWERLYDRRETYARGTVPMGALFLTAGVDVQKDRVIYEVVGWGRGKRSWSIDSDSLPGDTADLVRGPWAEVDALLNRTYPHAAGVEMPIRMLAVDSGYNTQTVYNWVRKYPWSRVMAVKGRDDAAVLVGTPVAVDVSSGGKKLKRAVKVWPVGVSMAKSELYGFLRLELKPGQAEPDGYCHFPQHGPDYFKQLTAEQLVPHKNRKGFTRLMWELIPGRANHGLDARVYARAAAGVTGLDRFQDRDWSRREEMLGVTAEAIAAAAAAAAVAASDGGDERAIVAPPVVSPRGVPPSNPPVPPGRRIQRSRYLGGGQE